MRKGVINSFYFLAKERKTGRNGRKFFIQKFFSFSEIGQKKCPKMKNEKKSLKISFLHCIIEIYRKGA